MKLIKRNEYLERLISVIGTPDIKVLTGIRRSGKSKLLEALKEYISENINDANIIHINLLNHGVHLPTRKRVFFILIQKNRQNIVDVTPVYCIFTKV